MPDTHETAQHESVQESLKRVVELLHKHELVESLVHKQDMPRHDLVQQLVHKQNLAELQKTLDALHPADVAYILEALPLDQRLVVWDLVRVGPRRRDPAGSFRCGARIPHRQHGQRRAARRRRTARHRRNCRPGAGPAARSDPGRVRVARQEEQAQLQSALSYPEGTVGALMDFDMVSHTRGRQPGSGAGSTLRSWGNCPAIPTNCSWSTARKNCAACCP